MVAFTTTASGICAFDNFANAERTVQQLKYMILLNLIVMKKM